MIVIMNEKFIIFISLEPNALKTFFTLAQTGNFFQMRQ